ncbi:MAG: CDP-glucose 4,6-dehydratase [bacterium]|nr:CDP-glucose 4,6-dehydratase [bacterium]
MSEFGAFYRGRRVLVTGDTGFKGSWLCLWLARLGADVAGFALPPPVDRPSNFVLSRVGSRIRHLDGDVRDPVQVARAVAGHDPEVVFHLAAQPLVRESLDRPLETFATNLMGTVHVLEALRCSPAVRSVVIVTTDKVYQNQEWVWGYRETDALGGNDPYSASKACAELAVAAYRHGLDTVWRGERTAALATARAGNVIGGGDWSKDRLVPDIVRAVAAGRPLELRMAHATRSWQHVLEPLSGYLLLGQRLAGGDCVHRSAWNFGPRQDRPVSVGQLARNILARWDREDLLPSAPTQATAQLGETSRLELNADKASYLLDWRPVWDLDTMVQATADWYAAHLACPEREMEETTVGQIEQYVRRATELGLPWASGAPSRTRDQLTEPQ